MDSVFFASLDSNFGSDTRVFVDESVKILWNADDKISIFNRSNENIEYRFKGETGQNSGSFEKVSEGVGPDFSLDRIFAIYPYNESNGISESSVLSFDFPSEQVYRSRSFGPGANVMVSVTDDNNLHFKNVAGYLVLKFYGEGVTVSTITLEGNNRERLAGKSSVSFAEGSPSITLDKTASGTITLKCESPVSLGSTKDDAVSFWMVVPPTDFTGGFTLTVTDPNDGTFVKTTTKDLSITRNGVLRISPIEVKIVPVREDLIEFDDDTFKSYCVDNFDTDGDGEICFSEAAVVQKIKAGSLGIASLEGIQYFTNLTSLICYDNDLTSVDISKNIALTELDIHSNSLTSLNISKNVNLSVLNCYDNQLTALDLRYNKSLVELNCRANSLSSLNVSNNPLLKVLYCINNQLTSLDVSNNTALKELYCNSNKITALDVSNNTALTTLYCNTNQLTSLKVGKSSSLKRIDCYSNKLTTLDVSDNTALSVLYCYSNQLTSLKVTNDTSLSELSCFSNRLTTIDVSTCPNLYLFNCYLNRLTSLELSNNRKLNTLNCYSNQLTSLDTSSCTSLVFLYCYSNKLTSIDVSKNTIMTHFQCNSNQLTSLDVSKNTKILFLYCQSNSLTSLDIRNNVSLRTLYCQSNDLSTLDVSKNRDLSKLNCSGNPSLSQLTLANGQSISSMSYDEGVTEIVYI